MIGQIGHAIAHVFKEVLKKGTETGLKNANESMVQGHRPLFSSPEFGKETLSHVSEIMDEERIQDLETSPLKSSMETINNSSLESLKVQNREILSSMEAKKVTPYNVADNEATNEIISEAERQQMKNESGWSDEIIDSIRSMKEFEIYQKAGLKEADINGRKSLVRDDIDWYQKDSMGRTNIERAQNGLSPINKNGDTVEIHHIGQRNDGPLAELTPEEHRGKENYLVLHDPSKASDIDRKAFDKERAMYWKARIALMGD